MQKVYRSSIVGAFAVLGVTLIIFLLAIAKKGYRAIPIILSPVVPNPVVPNPIAVPPANPTTTNDLPPLESVALSITSGTYELTNPATNFFLQAAPVNGVINVLINPLVGSKGRLITIRNATIPPATGNISVSGRGVVIVENSPIVIRPSNAVSLTAIEDNVYVLKAAN